MNCEVALEAAFAALLNTSEAQGWTPKETAATLLKIATEHAPRLEGAAAAELLTTKDKAKALAMAKDTGDALLALQNLAPYPISRVFFVKRRNFFRRAKLMQQAAALAALYWEKFP